MGKRKCPCCGEFNKPEDGLLLKNSINSLFCDLDCAIEYAQANKSKGKTKVAKEQKAKDKTRKKELMTRTQWFDKYQALVNQKVRIRDLGKPCCTCGAISEKVDAGHYKAVGRGGADRRRFMDINIHGQCRHCNSFQGGKPNEYREFLIDSYGIEKVEWLECEVNHPTLKESFPTWQDIESAITSIRKEIRALGFVPCR